MNFFKKMLGLFVLINSFSAWALSDYLIYPNTKGMPRCLESRDSKPISVYIAWNNFSRLNHHRIYYRKYKGAICKNWPRLDQAMAISLDQVKTIFFDNGSAPEYLEEFALDLKTRRALEQISLGLERFLPQNSFTDKTFLNSIFTPFKMDTHQELMRDVGENLTTNLYHSWIKSKNIPDQCSKLIGTCDYYLCREAQRPCGANGYFLGFAYRYCSDSLNRLINDVSPVGRKWLKTTATCLQQKMEESNPLLSCKEIKREAIEGHDKCYSEVSFCSLEFMDVLKIIKMVKPTLTEEGVFTEGVQVIGHCLGI